MTFFIVLHLKPIPLLNYIKKSFISALSDQTADSKISNLTKNREFFIQIFEEFASLSFQVSSPHQFWTDFKIFFDFVFFSLGLSNFG